MFIADHWQSFEVLDTGDGEKEVEQALLASGEYLRADVFKAAHTLRHQTAAYKLECVGRFQYLGRYRYQTT